MANDASPKIEPTLHPIADAPSIAPSDKDAETAKAEAPVTPKADEPVAAAPQSLPPAPGLTESILAESIKAETSEAKAEDKSETKSESQATIVRLPALRPAPKAEKAAPDLTIKPRVTRFAMLAACVAIAASIGVVGGAFGLSKLGPVFAAAPQPVAPAPKDMVAEEVKALKDTVAQLRATTKTLSDNLAALKTSVTSANNAQNVQIGRLAETIDRVEKTAAEQRKAAAAEKQAAATQAAAKPAIAASADVTGSIAAKPQQTAALDSQAILRNSIVQGWVLRRVYDGAALIEGRDGIIEVEPGMIAPGLGRVEGIKRQDGRWVVMTSRGLVIGR